MPQPTPQSPDTSTKYDSFMTAASPFFTLLNRDEQVRASIEGTLRARGLKGAYTIFASKDGRISAIGLERALVFERGAEGWRVTSEYSA